MHTTLQRCLISHPILLAGANKRYSSKAVGTIRTRDLHHDLESFLKYAKGVALPTHTTVYVGTLYEYTVKEALKSFGMSLERTGGSGDKGVDLRGTWTIPNLPLEQSQKPRIYDVLAQCKCAKIGKKISPAVIRELEGTVSSKKPETIGILAASKPCSPGIRKHLAMSPRPLMYLCLEEAKGIVEQIVWNAPASILLPGVGTKTIHRKGRTETVLAIHEHEFRTLLSQNLSAKETVELVEKKEGEKEEETL
ncbi:hypothetical protein L873DRAFT_1701289 [Choiromyces venosus 120613-1]|uniref:Required for respiratory growth protein 7, mitochondrial n=1 Tax=Choiromyces venosus 120613-1 TaxID=1336337 RepID=A0A3N4J883_9PEZI|nr:hypothetical protein L873DRAFT_1701289 [Choiromyces venosus 120613-1]